MAERFSLADFSLQELHRELDLRKGQLAVLIERRNRLQHRLDALSERLERMGSRAREPDPQSRFRNKKNLVDSIVEVLSGKSMSVPEITSAVEANGYRSSSMSFRLIVSRTLARNKRFKRLERGRYTTA